MGLEQFYGFLVGETDQWTPLLVQDNHFTHAPRREGYHLTEDLVDRTIAWVRDQQQAGTPAILSLTCPSARRTPRSTRPENSSTSTRAAFTGPTVGRRSPGTRRARRGRRSLIERVARCFHDGRAQDQVEYSVRTLVGQRIVGIALGYEDVSRPRRVAPLPPDDRYHKISHDRAALANLFVDLFLEAHKRPPKQIVLDLDATDDPLHGQQEGRFFHGYYGCHCYLPLYVFCGRHLLAALLRSSNIDASAGAVEEVARIVARIRQTWPRVQILLRADAGFAATS